MCNPYNGLEAVGREFPWYGFLPSNGLVHAAPMELKSDIVRFLAPLGAAFNLYRKLFNPIKQKCRTYGAKIKNLLYLLQKCRS
jgi:hypothetical protein